MNGPYLPLESRITSKRAARQPAADDTSKHTVHDAMCDLIKSHVVNALGSPDNLFRVQVRPVGTHSYRANVFVGKDATSARVANSYFLSADSDGNILSSTPKMLRLY